MASGKKTVLVTGATGFVGKASVAALKAAGWQVTQGVRSANSFVGGECISLDLSDPAAILALAEKSCFEAIVHLGAHVDLSNSTAADAQMYVPNVLSTGCLAKLARDSGARLIFASTAIVHGARTEYIGTNSSVIPDTAYASGKWLGEQLLDAAQIDACILRIAGIFGAGGPSHLGLNRAIDGAIKGQAPSQIGSGEVLRNYVYVKDVAQAIVHALQNELSGTHLLSGHDVMPIGIVLQEVCNIFLPGQSPRLQPGIDGVSQIIEPSPFLPKTRGYREALIDIRETVSL
ncbi:NAD(P)-dependent oxidoreductase [Dechloromonas denitrificans]|uniref:NAD-dependent epimerase/dehydratase family protein n=1 Tax=Dechloromonas denitrificans TaxID=281362 RepID=UPI001CF87480|nr:NAD(P)-dependent oxidoreductase [Dechloromonas denitrificans]UCV10583.1 NAD(P)-dependent oxidoreductase [Dechloromonas denitrificans]